MNRQSLIEWAAHWVGDENRERFTAALTAELKDWREPATKPVFCKKCPFAQHVHYEQDGKMVTPSCDGFEAMEGEKS